MLRALKLQLFISQKLSSDAGFYCRIASVFPKIGASMQKKQVYSLIAVLMCLSMVIEPASVAASLERNNSKKSLAMRRFLPPPITNSNDNTVEFDLSEGAEKIEHEAGNKVVVATSIPAARLQNLLKRLPPQEANQKSDEFNIPPNPTVPPKPGKIVNVEFPPKESLAPPQKVRKITSPLTVLRKSPEGNTANIDQVSVTFSQPMVPIADAESEVLAQRLPLKMSPQPKGKWRWQGTQTLVFTPENKLLPKATTYKLVIEKGTKSELGNALENGVSWTINTPAPTIRSFFPNDRNSNYVGRKLNQIMLISFDQKIDPKAVLACINVSENKVSKQIRLASEEEINADEEIKLQSTSLPAGTWLAVRATEKFQPAQAIHITVGPNIPSTEGPLTQKAAWNYDFSTYHPLGIKNAYDAYSSSGSLTVTFNNRLDTKLFKPEMVKTSPDIKEKRIMVNDTSIYIYGALQVEQTYTITIDKAITDIYGQTLGSDKSVKAKVRPSSPQLVNPEKNMVILQPSKKPSFSFLSSNHAQVKVSAYAASGAADFRKYLSSTQNYAEWHEKPEDYREFQGFKTLSSKIIKIDKSADQFNETVVDLSPYLKNGIGHVILTAESWPRKKDQVQRFAIWIQCSKIGLDYFTDSRKLVAIASSLEDGSPLSDVQIKTEGKTPNEGKTDKDGIFQTPFNRTVPSILIARKNDDETFLPSNPGYISDDSEPYNTVNHQDLLRWYTVTDRNLYKPGETLKAKGWIRRFGNGPKGDLSIQDGLNGKTISYRVTDGFGVELGKGETKADEAGGFTFNFDIPKTANLGNAFIEINSSAPSSVENTSTSLSFQIQEFRRPEFELKVKTSQGSMVLGDKAAVTASANYFAGGALADAPLHWDVQANETNYSPAGWDDYVFGKQMRIFRFFDYGIAPAIGGSSHAYFDGKTDGTGKHTLDLKIKTLKQPFPESIIVEGTVTDVNRQTWTDKATMILHPADNYIGIHNNKQFYKADEPIKLDAIVTDLDGKAIGGRKVHIDVSREAMVMKDNQWKSEDEVLVSNEINSSSKPETWEFNLSKGGNIKVSAVVIDEKGRKNKTELSFWREDKQPKTQDKVEQGKILLLADRKTYAPGDTAEIMIQAPFAKAKGVVSVRHNGILDSFPIALQEASGSVKIPITENFMPNAQIQVDLDGASCAYASGSLELSVPAEIRQIKMEVSPAEKALAPGASTKLSFKLHDNKGQALNNAQIAVAVVDESVLALSNYDWADPLSIFYVNTSSETSDYHSREYVLLNKKPEAPKEGPAASLAPPSAPVAGGVDRGFGSAGGGEVMQLAAPASAEEKGNFAAPRMQMARAKSAMLADARDFKDGADPQPKIALRTNFDSLAYFNPNLLTDSSGEASVEVKLPDNLTRYRVMAVAVSGEKLCGKGATTITARLPLMVRPSAPRFLNFGDKCEMPVVLQNQTDHEMSVDLGLRSSNLKFVPEAGPAGAASGLDTAHLSGGTVIVPPNDRVEVRFPMVTEDDGTAKIDVAASSEAYSDAANVNLPVYTPATTHAFAAYGQIDEGGAEQTYELPKDVYDQIGGLELSTSSTALQSLTDAYIYLHNYSFACSEQLSSRILATVALQNVLAAFNKMTATEIAAVKSRTQEELNELGKRQNYDGSFGLWKQNESHTWPFLTVQVTRALYEAKQKKYDVSDAVLSRAQYYLKAIDSHLPSKEYNVFTKRSIQAYALFVRHLMKDEQPELARNLVKTALASYDSKDYTFRRSGGEPVKGMSDQDKLLQVFSMETLGWLLPVLSAKNSDSSELKLVRTAIASHIRETASLAEIKDDGYGDCDYFVFYSSPRMNATILEALIMDQPKNDVIPKLAGALLAHRKAGKWESTQENCTALLALNRYFETYEKQVPDFVVNAWLGDRFISSSKFQGRSVDTNVTRIPMRYLQEHKQDKDILVSKTGKGRLYYRLALNYAPRNLRLPTFDNGFEVKRTYEAVDNTSDVRKDADGTWHFKAGATVKAKITLQVPGQRFHVALTDPFPAGMEPINAELAGNKTIHPELKGGSGSEDSGSGIAPYWRWWNWRWYEHQNLRDFRAEAFTSALWGGKYEYSYLMRATTPGDYLAPPCKAEEMYTPETFGRAQSEHVIIE